MVGHTGVIAGGRRGRRDGRRAASAAVVAAVAARGGACLVTADHGNSDHMLEPDGSPNTAHSTNLVPFVATVPAMRARDGGRLSDLAPTVLALLGVEQPAEMTGRDLLEPAPLSPAAPAASRCRATVTGIRVWPRPDEVQE